MKAPVICIDCSPLLVRSAGVKTYLYHWMNALRAQSPNMVKTFLAPANTGQLQHDGGPCVHPAKIAALLSLNRLPEFFCDLAVPRCDIFHCSNLLRSIPAKPLVTATMHDLTPWIMPQFHSRANVAAERMFAQHVLKRARALMADSESTKQDAIRILGLAPEKIRVIPLGVPARYFSVPAEDVSEVNTRWNLSKPYYLFVSTIEPRKNLDALLTAWESMPPSFRQTNELVIVGMPGWLAEGTMKRLTQANRDGQDVRYLGYLPEADLPGLTAGARAFVYPSLYEGFGLPVAQAMAAGCPVITSNVSSLPEVAGQAALLVDPASPAELKTAMLRLDESEELRHRLGLEGSLRAKMFTWENSAVASLQFFQEIS